MCYLRTHLIFHSRNYLFWWEGKDRDLWTQGLMLAKQTSTLLKSQPSLFLLLLFFRLLFSISAWRWPQTETLLPMASRVAGITGAHHHTWLCWDGVSLTLSQLALSLDRPDLYLQSGWDDGVSHWAWAAL
jgi:hypothetical protein